MTIAMIQKYMMYSVRQINRNKFLSAIRCDFVVSLVILQSHVKSLVC